MGRLKRLIGSPSALFTFEAAARHLSFTEAAAELNVSQAAVSAAVKSLERSLALQLFVRSNNRVELTEVGKKLYGDVAIGLGHIGQSLETLLSVRHDPHVTVSSSTAFASHWVLPRLPAFRLLHPSIDLRIQTSDRDTDLNAEKVPLGIRRGTGAWPEYESVPFADEVLVPVCSPDHLRSAGPVTSVSDLARRTLIHLEEPYRPRPTWRDWFAHHGFSYVDSGEGLRLNDYALVVQAAIGSQGIAIGWAHIVDYPLRQGLLVKAMDAAWPTGHRFYVARPLSVPVSMDIKLVRDWIVSDAMLVPADAGM